jgi:hypothetical protein
MGILNGTDAFSTNIGFYQVQEVFGNGTSVIQPTSTDFTVAAYGATNETGRTYVAYLFAHDAGGFGLTGTDNVISCGSYTGNGSTQTVTNGIDLSTKGGMVWSKSRSAATANTLYDTVRGATFELQSNAISGQTTESNGLNQFNLISGAKYILILNS